MKFKDIPAITIPRKWIYWITGLAVLGMVIAITLVNLQLNDVILDYLFPIRKKYPFIKDVIPFDDKLWLFGSSGGFAVLFSMALKNRQIAIFNQSVYLGALIAFILIALEEFSQIFIQSRGFDLLDLTCDILGIYVIGGLAYPFILTKIRFSGEEKS